MSGKRPRQEGVADDLVHRVVPADVLAQLDQVTLGRKEPGRVNATRLREE